MRDDVTQVEFAALLAVAQDHAFGQPPGSQLRATVLGQHLAAAAGVDAAERATTWWTSALRFLGCTGRRGARCPPGPLRAAPRPGAT